MTSSRTDAAPALVDVTMPRMGVSVAQGTVVGWPHAAGDPIRADETVCEISTDKIDTEVPAPVSGVLAEILVDAGATVPVGTVLARIAPVGHEPPVTPVVRRIAAAHEIDPSAVAGTGRGGRVTKRDVLDHLARAEGQPAESSPPAPASTATTLPRMRRQIGAHMKRSLETAATCTTWIEADMGRLEQERRRLGVTALPLVAAAVVAALREHPALNATLDGDRYERHADVNLGIAVSLGDEGLIVPVIDRAQTLSILGLAERIGELARRARAGELAPDEVRGATFTITNPGQFGTIMATPIINQPQVAILDLEAIVKRPVVVTRDDVDMLAIRPTTVLGLSWDHRALDGADAARFLAAVRRRLEEGTGG